MEIPTVPGDKVQIGHGPITCRSRADHVPITCRSKWSILGNTRAVELFTDREEGFPDWSKPLSLFGNRLVM